MDLTHTAPMILEYLKGVRVVESLDEEPPCWAWLPIVMFRKPPKVGKSVAYKYFLLIWISMDAHFSLARSGSSGCRRLLSVVCGICLFYFAAWRWYFYGCENGTVGVTYIENLFKAFHCRLCVALLEAYTVSTHANLELTVMWRWSIRMSLHLYSYCGPRNITWGLVAGEY